MRPSLALVPLCTLSALAAPVNQPEATPSPALAATQADQNTLTNQAAADLAVALSHANKAFTNLLSTIFDRVPDLASLENGGPALPSALSKRADTTDDGKKSTGTVYFYPDNDNDSAPPPPTPVLRRADKTEDHHKKKKPTTTTWTFDSARALGTTCEVLCKKFKCAVRGDHGNIRICEEEFFSSRQAFWKNGGGQMFDEYGTDE